MIRHTTIFERKKHSSNFIQGNPNFEIRIFEKYMSQKKKLKIVLKSPAEGYKMPPNQNFMKPVLEYRKNAAP